MSGVVGIVASSAGGVEDLRERLVLPLLANDRRVAVTLTPTAARWLESIGEVDTLTEVTGLPVRSAPRLPHEPSVHPQPDVLIAAPASANMVAKLALGIADNQALTVLCENIAGTPTVLFPRINAAHARQPAWDQHIESLLKVGVHLVYGEDVWPLAEPRTASGRRELPWASILELTESLLR